MTLSLQSVRREIDLIDSEILRLLNLRVQAAMRAGKLKAAAGRAVYDAQREDEIVNGMLRENTGPLNDAALERIFRRIVTESRLLAESVVESELSTSHHG